jgi:hypothetical protein
METQAQPAEPARRRSKALLWSLAGVAVLLVGCLGTSGFGLVALTGGAGNPTWATPEASASAAPGASDGAGEGSKRSSYPVRVAGDLGRVCDGWFFPKSPKMKAAGPSPVGVFVNERESHLYDIPYRSSAAVRKAWDPASPAKVRMVACVDLAGSGKQLKTCKFDDPQLGTVTLMRGNYRVTAYEVATGRKVLDKQVTGKDEKCPYVVLLGSARTIYSGVSDRQMFDLLRKYVEK